MNYKLYAAKGSGSTIVEALFSLADIDCEVEYLHYGMDGMQNSQLETLNPLRQVPTLVLPNGGVMTESAAIATSMDGHEKLTAIWSQNFHEKPQLNT